MIHDNPPKPFGDISVLTGVVDPQTTRPILPSLEPTWWRLLNGRVPYSTLPFKVYFIVSGSKPLHHIRHKCQHLSVLSFKYIRNTSNIKAQTKRVVKQSGQLHPSTMFQMSNNTWLDRISLFVDLIYQLMLTNWTLHCTNQTSALFLISQIKWTALEKHIKLTTEDFEEEGVSKWGRGKKHRLSEVGGGKGR